MGIVPSLAGWLVMDEPSIAIQFYGSLATLCIFIDQEVILATYQLQVALITLLTHEVALAKGYIRHVSTITIGVLSTAKEIESLANALEAANTLGLFIEAYISQYQVVRLLTVACHGHQPLVVLWLARWLGHQNPFILGSLYTEGDLELLAAHVARTLWNICIIKMRILCGSALQEVDGLAVCALANHDDLIVGWVLLLQKHREITL